MTISLHGQHEIRHSLTELRAYFMPMWKKGQIPDQAFSFLAAIAKRIEIVLDEENKIPHENDDTELKNNDK